VLHLSKFQSFIHATFKFLAERIHFILLLGHELRLGCQNLLVTLLHVGVLFFFFHFVCTNLHLMGVLVILLLCKTFLNTSEIEQFSRVLESERQILFELRSIFFQRLGVSVLQINNLLLILLLCSLEFEVPVLVEVLVLFDVGLLDLFLLLLVREHQLLILHIVLLLLEFCDPILCHLSLDVATFLLTCNSVLFHSSDKVFDIFLVDFSVLTTFSLFRAFCVSLHVLGFLMKFQPIKII